MSNTIEFWFSLVSPYAYLSAMRINELASAANVSIEYRPMAMPPIYSALGWKVNPFVDYPYKLDYVWHDVQRTASRRNLRFRKPDVFPQDPILATRTALIGFEQDWGWEFSIRFYQANFQVGCDPASPQMIRDILIQLKVDASAVLAKAQSSEGEERLSKQTDHALVRGVFGAPFFFVGSERYWGDDRLEMALEHASSC